MAVENKNCPKEIIDSGEKEATYCHIKLDSLLKLKDGTKKLLCVLEEIHAKTHSNNPIPDDTPNVTNLIKPIPNNNDISSITNVMDAFAIKSLEKQAKTLDEIYIEDEDNDCSIFKRLTRNCHCLNKIEYNDFIIHFNEDTKYFTSTLGEIIKNMRILKKFLYMGGTYTKNALLFLNEGFSDNPRSEKVEIALACSHADICNVFDEISIVAFCIVLPFKYEHYGDSKTQASAAALLMKLSLVEEGRRYLNFSSKITNDIKKLLRKKSNALDYETLEFLNSTLNLINPPLTQHINVTYYCKTQEGMAHRTLCALAHYRLYMTLEEIFTHLDLLQSMSDKELGKAELRQHLPTLLSLFKHLLMEYDNDEINMIVTNILNNVLTKNILKKENEIEKSPALIVADMTTEPIKMKNDSNQMPLKRRTKKIYRSKLGLTSALSKKPKSSKRLASEVWAYCKQLNTSRTALNWQSTKQKNQSINFNDLRDSIIVVPMNK